MSISIRKATIDLGQQKERAMNKRRQKNEGRGQKFPCSEEVLNQSDEKKEVDLNPLPSALCPLPLRAQPDYYLEQEILELKQSCFELNQELEVIKKLLQQRQISPKQVFLFIKVLIFILVGINAQGGNFQFNGDHLLPIVDTLSNEEIDNNL